jgi:hypothetical protein
LVWGLIKPVAFNFSHTLIINNTILKLTRRVSVSVSPPRP